jgi:hypothetical protein
LTDGKPIPAFKHLKLKRAEEWKAGLVRIGSLEYFRGIENVPNGIDDLLEGKATGLIQHTEIGPKSDLATRESLARWGIKNRGSTHIVNTRITTRVQEQYVLCFSAEEKNIWPEYEEVIGFPDLRKIAIKFAEAAPEDLGEWTVGYVEYLPRDLNFLENHGHAPSAFMKGPDFATQKEIRITWTPLREPKLFIDIRSDYLADK